MLLSLGSCVVGIGYQQRVSGLRARRFANLQMSRRGIRCYCCAAFAGSSDLMSPTEVEMNAVVFEVEVMPCCSDQGLRARERRRRVIEVLREYVTEKRK